MKEIYLKEDCDLLIRNDEIYTTENNSYESLKFRILQRIQSNPFDWVLSNSGFAGIASANLGQYIGNSISNEIISMMKRNIFEALVFDDLVSPENVYIQEAAIDRENIIFYVSLKVENKSQEYNLGLSVMYNTRQNITSSKIEKISEEPWL